MAQKYHNYISKKAVVDELRTLKNQIVPPNRLVISETMRFVDLTLITRSPDPVVKIALDFEMHAYEQFIVAQEQIKAAIEKYQISTSSVCDEQGCSLPLLGFTRTFERQAMEA